MTSGDGQGDSQRRARTDGTTNAVARDAGAQPDQGERRGRPVPRRPGQRRARVRDPEDRLRRPRRTEAQHARPGAR